MVDILTRATRSVFSKSPRETVKWGRYHLYERYRERRLGIETATSREWKEWLQGTECTGYEPLSYACIDTALRSLRVTKGQDVLVDYGCGKGRVLAVAATLPFKRVVGVEMSPELSEDARANLRRVRRRRCPAAEVVTADATTYPLPDDATVLFLFNPFQGEVLAQVQAQIRESLARAPRPLTLIYMHPIALTDTFARYNWLTLKRPLPTGAWEGVRFVVYEHRPHST